MDYSPAWSASATTLTTLPAHDSDDDQTIIGGSTGSRPPRRQLVGPCKLTMSPDTIKNTSFFNSEDHMTEYTVETRSVRGSCTRTEVLDTSGRVVGAFTRPMTSGSDMVFFGQSLSAGVKRKSWLATTPFSGNVLGKFEHEGKSYKWIKIVENKEDKRTPILELHPTDSPSSTLARFAGSRKDPSAPPEALVIIDATLEVFVDNPSLVEVIVFSFVLVEKLRRDVAGQAAIGLQDASARVTNALSGVQWR